MQKNEKGHNLIAILGHTFLQCVVCGMLGCLFACLCVCVCRLTHDLRAGGGELQLTQH